MKLTVAESVSLDGVMQGLGGPDEDRRGGFEPGGWQIPVSDEAVGAFLNDVYVRGDAPTPSSRPCSRSRVAIRTT